VVSTGAEIFRVFFTQGPLLALAALPLLWLGGHLPIFGGAMFSALEQVRRLAVAMANLVLPIVAQDAKAGFVGNAMDAVLLPFYVLAGTVLV